MRQIQVFRVFTRAMMYVMFGLSAWALWNAVWDKPLQAGWVWVACAVAFGAYGKTLLADLGRHEF